MESVDSYYASLDDIASAIENAYGIGDMLQAGKNDIVSVVRSINGNISQADKGQVAKLNQEAGKNVVLLAYLCFRFDFFKIVRFDFSVFYAVDEVQRILHLLTVKDNFNSKNLRMLNRLIKILAKADENSSKTRYGLAYRYMRIFITLILYNSSCNASIVANLLLEQIALQNRGGKRA